MLPAQVFSVTLICTYAHVATYHSFLHSSNIYPCVPSLPYVHVPCICACALYMCMCPVYVHMSHMCMCVLSEIQLPEGSLVALTNNIDDN